MSELFDVGGPAFPQPDTYLANGQVEYGSPGMSLRDWFAGQTLSDCLFNATPADIARNAYAIADAMIKYRKESPR
jgi:hypothetical protein